MRRGLRDAGVVITGASSGIGRATALEFAAAGADVMLVARREAALEDVASRCRMLGVSAFCHPADVANPSAIEGIARVAAGRFETLDVWVNNAAVTAFGPFEEIPIEDHRRIVETNVLGPIHGSHAALRWFREQGRGVLVNVTSVVGAFPIPSVSTYVATRAAVLALTEALDSELHDAPGIHACAVLPASIDTPLFQHAANYSGRRVRPLTPLYAPRRVARAVVSCARWPRRTVVVGPAGRASLVARRLAPRLVDRLAARRVRRAHFGDWPEPRNSGNVHAPDGWTSETGGWQELLDQRRS